MADIFTPEHRSYVMSRIRGQNTKPEVALRSMLHRMGYRFTVNGPKNKSLPGRPDVVLPRYRTVVFVHGCFWHGHEGCGDFRLPGSRVEWWTAKITGNKARDLRNENALRSLGWHVVTIWACALKNASARLWLENRLPSLLGKPLSPLPMSLPKVAQDPACIGSIHNNLSKSRPLAYGITHEKEGRIHDDPPQHGLGCGADDGGNRRDHRALP